MHVAKAKCRPGTFLLHGADYSLGIRFKMTAAILAVVQHLLSYNTCRRFLLLRSDSFSWLLHLPGNIVLAGSKSRGIVLLTRETHFCRCYQPNPTFDTCQGIFFAGVINWILTVTLAVESHFRRCHKLNLTFNTCGGISFSPVL